MQYDLSTPRPSPSNRSGTKHLLPGPPSDCQGEGSLGGMSRMDANAQNEGLSMSATFFLGHLDRAPSGAR